MQKIWQKHWFGIRFNEFTYLDENKIADKDFYKKFYDVLFNRFSGYNDLPKSWLASKSQIAKDIYLHFPNKNILSIGCGIGWIETTINNLINESHGNGTIVALDPSITECLWMPTEIDFRKGYFPDAVKGEIFDVAYASVIDYCMNDDQYIRFLSSVYDFGIKEFMLAELMTGQFEWEFQQHVKEILKNYLL